MIIYDRVLSDFEKEKKKLCLGREYGNVYLNFTSSYSWIDLNVMRMKKPICFTVDGTKRDVNTSVDLTINGHSNKEVGNEYLSFTQDEKSAIFLAFEVIGTVIKRLVRTWVADRTAGCLGTIDLIWCRQLE
ncbi:MAG: hypothetical protein COB98_09495 [Flavobacteriaceae bacterium]|nr:MAG: hypothetical protein COB98_09495 [Flavobacteriaceae bacterium]